MGKPAVELGTAYLGLVGCLSAGRIATLHADACARDYLARVDRLRAKLRLSDAELCPVVPGECSGRVAQIEALRRDAKKVREPRR
jgi:hypothetical protein